MPGASWMVAERQVVPSSAVTVSKARSPGALQSSHEPTSDGGRVAWAASSAAGRYQTVSGQRDGAGLPQPAAAQTTNAKIELR